MTYAEWSGPRSGAPVWRSTAEGSLQRVLPDAAADLMWFDGQLIVAGPDTTAITFRRTPGERTWGLRFAPGLAHELLGISMHELANLRVPLTGIVGPSRHHHAFESDIGGALEVAVLNLCESAAPDRNRLGRARTLDTAARAGWGARAAAESLGVSERTLHRCSLRWFGYSYQKLVMIHRFQRAVQIVHAGRSLSDAAVLSGYADQAHFTRECRRLSGMTPSMLIRPSGV
ncbi:helix-turn-helix transcriptional regulator [Cumulibacter soli]|uniref:helix-turn-helix transcriptional regulator n=1 Tax=Cumulibacter soli TaxID=2546344 RepID=UPI0010680944|nr:helix-turn-helix transcriptional regulator [Cumulibacter soli]